MKASSQKKVPGITAATVLELAGSSSWSWLAKASRSGWHLMALPGVFSLGKAMKGSRPKLQLSISCLKGENGQTPYVTAQYVSHTL